jgi:ribonuclease III
MNEISIDNERLTLLEELEQAIDYKFRQILLLDQALTHKSFVYENNNVKCYDNESLEFLGDAVLGFLSSSELFLRNRDLNEGKLSKIKAFLVSSANLYKKAQALNLGKYIRLGYGEEKSGGREKRAIQVDAYEAMVAAIYLDGGIERAAEFVRREFLLLLSAVDLWDLGYADYKSTLQEKLHLMQRPEPRYRTVDEIGPDHKKTFIVEVLVHDEVIARAQGRTKKEAQQEAARLALENIVKEEEARRQAARLRGDLPAPDPALTIPGL